MDDWFDGFGCFIEAQWQFVVERLLEMIAAEKKRAPSVVIFRESGCGMVAGRLFVREKTTPR